jgi:hypothetical protein
MYLNIINETEPTNPNIIKEIQTRPDVLRRILMKSESHLRRLDNLKYLYEFLQKPFESAYDTVALIIGGSNNQNYPDFIIKQPGYKVIIAINDEIGNLPPDAERISRNVYFLRKYGTVLITFLTLVPTNLRDELSRTVSTAFDNEVTFAFWTLLRNYLIQIPKNRYIVDHVAFRLTGTDKSKFLPELNDFILYFKKFNNVNVINFDYEGNLVR